MRSWQERPSVRYPRIFTLVLLVVVALLFYLGELLTQVKMIENYNFIL